MAKSSMGVSTSGSRIDMKMNTAAPKASKVISNTAGGASMNVPAGGKKMRLETFPPGKKPKGEFGAKGPHPKVL